LRCCLLSDFILSSVFTSYNSASKIKKPLRKNQGFFFYKNFF